MIPKSYDNTIKEKWEKAGALREIEPQFKLALAHMYEIITMRILHIEEDQEKQNKLLNAIVPAVDFFLADCKQAAEKMNKIVSGGFRCTWTNQQEQNQDYMDRMEYEAATDLHPGVPGPPFKDMDPEYIKRLGELSASIYKKTLEGHNTITPEQLEILSKIVKPREANILTGLDLEELEVLQLIKKAGAEGITLNELTIILVEPTLTEEDDENNMVMDKTMKVYGALRCYLKHLEEKDWIRTEPLPPPHICRCWFKETENIIEVNPQIDKEINEYFSYNPIFLNGKKLIFKKGD
jgi:hypothetical protein